MYVYIITSYSCYIISYRTFWFLSGIKLWLAVVSTFDENDLFLELFSPVINKIIDKIVLSIICACDTRERHACNKTHSVLALAIYVCYPWYAFPVILYGEKNREAINRRGLG